MGAGAQLSVTDLRRASRHPVEHTATGENRAGESRLLQIVNISAQGFMIDNGEGLERGGRLTVPLPGIGRIEAYVIWVHNARAGFQFERILRLDDFKTMMDQLQPNPRLRRTR